MISGDLIIRTDLGNGLTSSGEPPLIGFELRYPGTTVQGHLARSLRKDVANFLRRENFRGDVMLRSYDLSLAPQMKSELLSMRTLIELAIRNRTGEAIVDQSLMTR